MKIYQVDAFTDRPFAGNPAAVVPLDASWHAAGEPTDAWMQALAAEMNLSETALVAPHADGAEGAFELRWFTPATEVSLCGHATVATAHVLYETGRLAADLEARFHTLSGVLRARRPARGTIELDFPAAPAEPWTLSEEAARALGVDPAVLAEGAVGTARKAAGDGQVIVELPTAADVLAVAPDMAALGRLGRLGWIVTAHAAGLEQAAGADFVSRFFAPALGVDEDPVTGSAHCALVPWWCRRLDRERVVGYQASARGGTVDGRLGGDGDRSTNDRVLLRGGAVTVLEGELTHSSCSARLGSSPAARRAGR
ncbi:MAG: PhzF family phenazine biosynthesis protein [Acidobacteriota bacterium]